MGKTTIPNNEDRVHRNTLFSLSPYASELKRKLETFVLEKCQPAEVEYERHMEGLSGADRWTPSAVPPCMERLKQEAKQLGLWNLFLPHTLPPAVVSSSSLPAAVLSPAQLLSNREYGILCEIMGKSFLAPEACNCSAPDTGNMEVLLKFGTQSQQNRYLKPLLEGTIRSSFLMTEPNVASSDATNMETRLTKIIDTTNNHHPTTSYILNGQKWWSTGAMDPRTKVVIVLARMDYSHPSCSQSSTKSNDTNRHGAHTMILLPMDQAGVKLIRPLSVFGYDDAPHGHAEVHLENVVLDSTNLILGEGRGFEIAQSRLGPGRIHHCMRAVGLAQRCYDLMLDRTLSRRTFGKSLYEHGGCQNDIANSKMDLECARLLTLTCAAAMDESGGAQRARDQIAMIKVAVPRLTLRVVDRAVQVFGGAGVCQDFVLARALAGLRTLRIADGPDAVHMRTLALLEVKKRKKRESRSKL